MADKEQRLFQNPVGPLPSVEEIQKLAADLHFTFSDEDAKACQGVVKEELACYTRLDHIPEPALEVKYPRTPGHRPLGDDNPCNAWAQKCTIKGASSGPLAGKTIAIKDNIAVAGVPLMNGSRILEGYTPSFDATVVTKVLDAGATILGKSQVEDLCISGSSFTSAFGPVQNPSDKKKAAGGSSSGSAALVKMGIVDFAIGGDQGGSIRIPSSYSGIVGLKPTWGLVPYTGAMSIEPTLDHLGPMAICVDDVAKLLSVLAVYDNGLDFRQQANAYGITDYASKLTDEHVNKKWRIGLVTEGFNNCTPEAQECVRKAIQKVVNDRGAEITNVSIPEHKDGGAIITPLLCEGLLTSMLEGASNGFGHKGFYATEWQSLYGRGLKLNSDQLSETTKIFALIGQLMKYKYHNKYYAKACNLERWLRSAYDIQLAKYDVLVMPTLPSSAIDLPTGDELSLGDYLVKSVGMIDNTAPFNVTGHPALTLNAAGPEEMPTGLMVIAKHNDDLTALQVGKTIENVIGKTNIVKRK